MTTSAADMTPGFALACWERALTEEYGLVLTLDKEEDKRVIEKTLYEARQKSGNPDLEQLMIVRPGDNVLELMIIKKTTDMEDFR